MSATRRRNQAGAGGLGVLWLLGVVLMGFALASCREEPSPPPPECDGGEGEGDDRPDFVVAQGGGAGGGGGSCDLPPCPDCGSGSGDPHVRTFDGLSYDYQGAAEVVAARSPDGAFEVQWRLEPRGASFTSSISAVALSIEGTRITFVGEEDVVKIDGEPLTGADESIQLASGVTIYRDRSWVIVVGPEGDGAVHISRSRWLTVLVDAPEEFRGSMDGLLGNADGDREDDRALLPESAEDFDLILGETWRLTDESSLFDYDEGLTTDDFWDPTFPPERPARLDSFSEEQRAAAEAECRAAGVTDEVALADCIYDLLVIGDPEVIEDALRLQARQTENLAMERAVPGAATPTTQTPVADMVPVGQTITGSIDDEGETKSYAFDLTESQIVFFEGTQDDDCEAGNVRWFIAGPNSSGETDTCNDIGRFIASATGTYEITVRGVTDRGTGPYTLTIIDVPADRIEALDANDTQTDEIARIGERHRFTFDLTEDQIVFFEGTQDDDCEAGNVRWFIAGPNSSGETDTCNDIGRFIASATGTYEITVRGVTDRGTGPYTLTIIDVPADRIEALDANDTQTDEIARIGERHRFTFDLTEDQIVFFEGTQDDDCEAGNVRWFIAGPNSSGETDTCNDIGRFIASATGTYEITVRGVTDRGTGPYTLTIIDVPADRIEALDANDTQTDEIARIGERHRFTFDLTEDQIVFFEGTQDDDCEAGNVRWFIAGPNSSGETDTCNDIGRFIASDTGTYEITVRGVTDRGTGPYTLTIIDVPADRIEALDANDTQTDEIARIGERHRFTFDLTEDQIVFFEGTQDDDCEAGNVRWFIAGPNSSGETDTCNDIGRFIASATGTYEITVRGVTDRGTGPYTLTVLPE